MSVAGLLYSETYRFPGCRVRVDSAVKYAISDLSEVYRCFLDGLPGGLEPTFLIRRHAGKLRLTRTGGDPPREGSVIERGCVMPFLERAINQYLVESLADQLLLHGAGVGWRGRAIVLPARAGSGKTTLAAGLVRGGCGYLGDELVILQARTSSIVPFPKAMSLKEGSFALFESLGPDPTGPKYDRVWYLDPERLRPGSVVKRPTPIGWVVLPRYEAGATTRIEALTVGETVLGLFENTVNTPRHKEKGLDRLIGIAKSTPGYRLVFGALDEACEAVLEIVEGNGRPCT